MNIEEKIKGSETLSSLYWFVAIVLCILFFGGLIRLIHVQEVTATTDIRVEKNAFTITWNDAGEEERQFMASKNGEVYYPIGCKSGNRIKAENRIYFGTVVEAVSAGFRAAKNC